MGSGLITQFDEIDGLGCRSGVLWLGMTNIVCVYHPSGGSIGSNYSFSDTLRDKLKTSVSTGIQMVCAGLREDGPGRDVCPRAT